jgi:hypothetical protein
MRLGFFVFATSTAAIAGGVHADLITNGGFEPTSAQGTSFNYSELVGGGDTSINGWTTIPTGVEWFSPSGEYGLSNSPQGGYCVDLANFTTTPGGIQQSVTTAANSTYSVSFYYGTSTYAGRDGNSAITVAANALITPFTLSTTSSDITWVRETFSFVADSASTTLTFKFSGDPFVNFAFIDGVSMQLVPLPTAAWSGMATLAGVAGFGLIRRRALKR